MITLDQLTPTQRVWVLRLPLLTLLFVVFVLPIIILLWYGINGSDDALESAFGILACYAMFGITGSIPFFIELYGSSNKLSIKMKAIKAQQADDADEWGRIFDAYRRTNTTPRYTHTNAERQRARDDEWKRRWDAL